MKRFHYDKETGLGYLIKNNDIDGKPTIKIVFKVKKNKIVKELNFSVLFVIYICNQFLHRYGNKLLCTNHSAGIRQAGTY